MPDTLKVGVQLPEVEREIRWTELRQVALTAEAVGFDSIWLGDHLLYRDEEHGIRGPWEAWSLLAALGEATERISLGPLVASTSFHAPAMLAKKAATVDEISGGRLILGLGAGWNRVEYEAFGFPFDHRVDRFEEAFTIIRTLLNDGHIDFEGDYYTVRDCELAPRARPGIPLMVGSNGARMLEITLPHVAYWNTWHSSFGNDVAGLLPLLAQIQTACVAAGRAPGEVERTAAVYIQLPGGSGRITGRGVIESDTARTGTREELAQLLRDYAAAGVGHVQLCLDPIDSSTVEEMGEVLRLID
ncbi:MAG TPA: LLM class flavin-dependent oxidoreductase [Acidimicrobiia bacterium]|nr:LLM class flavin-dependent oxidoreductase [Acidimicrobiia bacterium]